MSPSFAHREALLQPNPEFDLQPLNSSFSDSAEPAAESLLYPPRPMLGVTADWNHHLQSFRFDPLLRSPFFYSLGQRREYYPVMALTVLVWIMLVFQSVIGGWAQVSIVVVLQFVLNLPILLIELTRMDRRLLWRLLCTFEWWYLCLTYFLMQSMSLIRTLHIQTPPAADIVYFGVLNSIFLIASIYTISMDCLVNSSARNKIIWLCIFITSVGAVFVITRMDYHFDEDVKLCLVYCANAGSIQSSCMLTVLAFALKFLVNLIRRPQCLMILGPACKLTQHDNGAAIV